MDRPRGIDRRGADAQGPGTALVLARGEEAEQAEESVGQADDAAA
jgi:hypothetical protein